MKILVIAPHADDEVLGCGATSKKKVLEGDEVYRCIVTSAYTPDWSSAYIKNRKKEIVQSGKILGIKETVELDFPAAKLSKISEKDLINSLAKVIEKIRPTIVFLPFYRDIHRDHQIVHNASLVACRPINKFIKTILMYETLSETEWGNVLFHPQWYEDISLTFAYKIKAMKAYESEVKQSPHPRSLEIIEVLARKRGSEVHRRLCEAFQVVRMVKP